MWDAAKCSSYKFHLLPHLSSSVCLIFFPEKWGVQADGDGTSKRGLVASGQSSYLAPAWRKNCFWLGRGQPSDPRGLDAAGTPWEPIRKAIDQFPLISQLVSTSPLQSKTRQLSQTDRGLAGFQRLEPSQKWIHRQRNSRLSATSSGGLLPPLSFFIWFFIKQLMNFDRNNMSYEQC